MPIPQPHRRSAELATRALAEARAMAGAAPAVAPRTHGELAAAALSTHGALSAGRVQPVSFTALGPGGGVRELAVFLTVYAAQQEQHGIAVAEQGGGGPDGRGR
ncbi:hypothetical protein [Streptomyces sp. NPDC059639]|uniref:hypothetical protein n=1 Tax=Streptomyces sp. NPDC059639 TaxID=3346891 RepID=UPI0036A48B58